MDIKQNIKDFYNQQANKFSQTRKKIWPEFKYIEEEVKNILKTQNKIKILELGCGDGRLYRYLDKIFLGKIDYIGVDISENLISIATKEQKENAKFIVDDMLNFTKNYKQCEDFDLIIAVASFQHIPTKSERLETLKELYRLAKYNGEIIMFNWSFSKWFIKKYFKQILKSFILDILSLGSKPINDIMIPWKENNQIYYRYYHIFFLKELLNLFKQASFIIKEYGYINKKGLKDNTWINSRNSYVIGIKQVLKN